MKVSQISKKVLVAVADFETYTIKSNYYKKYGHTDVGLYNIKILKEPSIGKYQVQTFTKEIKEEHIGFSIDDFMDKVISYRRSMVIYFHNLDFDGDFIWKWFIRHEYWSKYILYEGINDHEWIGSNGRKLEHKPRIVIFRDGNRIFSIEWRIRDYKTKLTYTIRFQCSYKIVPSSIKTIGIPYNIAKHDNKVYEELFNEGLITSNNPKDFYDNLDEEHLMNPRVKQAFINYIKDDTLAQFYGLYDYYNYICHHDKWLTKGKDEKRTKAPSILNKLTVGSIMRHMVPQATKEYDKKHGTQIIKGLKVKSKKMVDLMKKFYNGGFTQFNSLYFNKDVHLLGLGIDINSSYAFQMTKLLPYGDLLEEKPEGEYLEWVIVKAKYFKIKKEYENIPILKKPNDHWDKQTNDRYMKRGVNYTGYHMKLHFDIMKKIYDFEDLEIETYYTKAARFLKDFMEDLYYERARIKESDPAKAQAIKFLLNSGYGSLAMDNRYSLSLYMWKDDFEKCKKEWENNENQIFEYKGLHYQLETLPDRKEWMGDDIPYEVQVFNYEDNEKDEGNFNNLLIAAAITSYARIDLFETMLTIGFKNVIYSDTDSIFLKVSDNKNNENKHWSDEDIKNEFFRQVPKMKDLLDEKRLGAWKIEVYFDKLYIKKAKGYSFLRNGLEVKKATAGLNTFDDYDTAFEALHVSTIVKGKMRRFEDEHGIYFDYVDIDIKDGKQ